MRNLRVNLSINTFACNARKQVSPTIYNLSNSKDVKVKSYNNGKYINVWLSMEQYEYLFGHYDENNKFSLTFCDNFQLNDIPTPPAPTGINGQYYAVYNYRRKVKWLWLDNCCFQ